MADQSPSPLGGAKSTAYNGRFDETRAELQELVAIKATSSGASRGRKIALALLDSVEDIATPADTVNVSVNYSPGITGQLNITAVLTLMPAPAGAV
jgi:hypothetical protein